ncbi:hypothetical protein BU16DRAFT_590262 [Lophium mytilinum]|uniref:Uncharacterized protein n=1 Tax=Lophium mytilinum TaxID=390894 RepID=A0A6A6QSL8_9PEZI|nr:hypothetical protein BU16DRAFT_590262 [Lophium mytilinum]
MAQPDPSNLFASGSQGAPDSDQLSTETKVLRKEREIAVNNGETLKEMRLRFGRGSTATHQYLTMVYNTIQDERVRSQISPDQTWIVNALGQTLQRLLTKLQLHTRHQIPASRPNRTFSNDTMDDDVLAVFRHYERELLDPNPSGETGGTCATDHHLQDIWTALLSILVKYGSKQAVAEGLRLLEEFLVSRRGGVPPAQRHTTQSQSGLITSNPRLTKTALKKLRKKARNDVGQRLDRTSSLGRPTGLREELPAYAPSPFQSPYSAPPAPITPIGPLTIRTRTSSQCLGQDEVDDEDINAAKRSRR